jgi:hypothetical protein
MYFIQVVVFEYIAENLSNFLRRNRVVIVQEAAIHTAFPSA